MKKRKVLFVYQEMMIGGSTTSLLSILNMLNYDKYDVDLLLERNTGDLFDKIPSSVQVLKPARRYQNKKSEYLHRFMSPRYIWHYLKSRKIIKKSGSKIHGYQYRDSMDIDFYRQISDEYDVVISFLEGSCCAFASRHINAKRRIAWIHVNYFDAEMDPKYDRNIMNKFDRIVLVSNDCKRAFDECFPSLASKSMVIENILSTEFVQNRGEEQVELKIDKHRINLVTTCRISFSHKGLDRAVLSLAKIKQKVDISRLKWYIIGDGVDIEKLRNLIIENNLSENVVLLGMKKNPIPYLKDMSMFFLPSIYEGKPMAVTEAFMMGLPALVTEYSSAREQVRDGVDGIIVENSEQGINDGLLRIIENPEIIEELKKNVIATDYSNVEEMKKVEALIDGVEF